MLRDEKYLKYGISMYKIGNLIYILSRVHYIFQWWFHKRKGHIHSEIYLKCMTVHTIMTMNIKMSTERWLLPTIACHSCTLCSLSMQNTSDFLWNVASKLGHLWMDDMPGYTNFKTTCRFWRLNSETLW